RRRHTRFSRDWSSDVCSSDLVDPINGIIIFAQTDVDIHTYNSEFETFSGLRTGFYLYTSPLQSLNHSFRLGYQVILQNRHGYNEIGRASCRERAYIIVVVRAI